MDSSQHEHKVDELIASYLQAIERGEEKNQTWWIAKHPEYADDLRAFFRDNSRVRHQVAAAEAELPDTTVDKQGLPIGASPRIGNFKLLQLLGTGGMGEVWMAEQEKPVRRRVALKLIKQGMDSRAVLARFDAERQALALMNHPNIAKVFEAGIVGVENHALGIGRPYFVMELVKGIPITEFCDSRRLNIRERLKLFCQCCNALHHAHQKGIIHRDLKPTNILVESHDDEPVLKVIDFGLAKAFGGTQLTEQTLFTAMGTVAGTPLYMAPEQAVFNALDVDIRVDIYSLGVLLYELLTGTTPLTSDRLKEKGLDEMLKLVRDFEPPSPSQRLSTSPTLAGIAATRQTEPQRLGRFMRGELDWIVMKALARERERRYGSALAFSEDVECFLKDDPVKASPPSNLYHLQKFARRHRGPILAASALLLAMAIGLFGTTYWLLQARHLERVARTAERRAIEAQHVATMDRDAKDRALSAESMARKESEAQRSLAEQNLIQSILRPIGIDRHEIHRSEIESFISWAAIPSSRLRMQVLETALRDTEIARGLSYRSERVIQACIGMSHSNLLATTELLNSLQAYENSNMELQFFATRLAIPLGKVDERSLIAAVRNACDLDNHGSQWKLDQLDGLLHEAVPTFTQKNDFVTIDAILQSVLALSKQSSFFAVNCIEEISPALNGRQVEEVLQTLIEVTETGEQADDCRHGGACIEGLVAKLSSAQHERAVQCLLKLESKYGLDQSSASSLAALAAGVTSEQVEPVLHSLVAFSRRGDAFSPFYIKGGLAALVPRLGQDQVEYLLNMFLEFGNANSSDGRERINHLLESLVALIPKLSDDQFGRFVTMSIEQTFLTVRAESVYGTDFTWMWDFPLYELIPVLNEYQSELLFAEFVKNMNSLDSLSLIEQLSSILSAVAEKNEDQIDRLLSIWIPLAQSLDGKESVAAQLRLFSALAPCLKKNQAERMILLMIESSQLPHQLEEGLRRVQQDVIPNAVELNRNDWVRKVVHDIRTLSRNWSEEGLSDIVSNCRCYVFDKATNFTPDSIDMFYQACDEDVLTFLPRLFEILLDRNATLPNDSAADRECIMFLRAIRDSGRIVNWLKHPGALGKFKNALLLRLEEIELYGAAPIFSAVTVDWPDEYSWNELDVESRTKWLALRDALPERQLCTLSDAIEWLEKNRPDIDLEAPFIPEENLLRASLQ